ncbi:MAG TPA: hypothetical protein VN934_10265 [Candidatus Tumulicola sp.]|nr:hypothetical protein [Candidatus Tumulicola sp.]
MSSLTPRQLLDAARSGDLDRLGAEPNAVADAVRSFANAGDGASALALAAGAWRIWLSRGELEQGSAVLSLALDAPGAGDPSPARARVLYADGLFAFRKGNQERSRARNEEALRVARAAFDPRGECDALTGLARVALRDGDYARVAEFAEEARRRAQAAGDREAEAGPLHLLAAGIRLGGDYGRARDLYAESLELNRGLGKAAWVTMELHNLGWVELHLGDVKTAASRFRERDSGPEEDAQSRAWRNLNWAAVAAARGDELEARRLFAEGKEALANLGMALDPDDKFELGWLSEKLNTSL